MSDDRKKVKDLATELGLTPKEVLAAAKDLGISAAKVAASSLSDLESARLRSHFAPAEPAKQQVIVRRKRAASPEAEIPAVEEAAPMAPAPEATLEAASAAPVSATEPSQQVDVSAPEKQESAEPEKKNISRKAPAAARVIHRPSDTAALDASTATSQETATQTAPQAEAPAAATAKKPAVASSPPEATVVVPVKKAPASAAEPATIQESKAAPQKARAARPAAFSAEPERGADGQALSSAPVLSSRGEQESDRGHSFAEGDEDARQHPSQVRVISRPDPRQPEPRSHANRQERAPGGFRPRPAGQDARPAGAAAPGRSGGYTPRPASGSGAGPGIAPAPDSEQGRKKRQKGRRTVEFGDSRARGDEDTAWSKTAGGRRGKQRKQREMAPVGGTQPVKAAKRKIRVDEFIRVADLAHQMQLKSGEIIKVLFSLGVMATINQSLDIDTATLVANEFGYEIEKTGFDEQDIIGAQQDTFEENPEDYVPRPPVVTIMGHVDHGKTSLLDAIRKSSVVTGEAGGITQHIGAYHVKTKKGEIVFLDTPGHEAFTAMRARGAEVTDIVVLVVAADDGVMEQTREAINHARAAKVPIMVAVNKMDKEGANPDRVKRELAEQGLVAEDWGGDTTFSYVSAKTREGLDDLLELLALQAEILELKANPKRPAVGYIVEAKLDKGRGSLGTVLIQQGTLHMGDAFVCGVHSGRVRAMFNDQGKKVKEAGPSMPVEVQGFEGVPEAGEEFLVIADEKQARRIAEARALKQRERELAKESKITLETFLARKADSVEAEVLNLVVKADVRGSLEAITDALHKLSTEKVRINVIHGGTGAVSESDVLLATASNAIIIGFNVRPTSKAKELAEQEKVDIRFYDIIYKLVEEIRSAMEGMLAPVQREVFLGTADVRETFSVPKAGVIAGSHVSDGKITRNARARLLRDGVVVYTGKIASLRRFKDDVREVTKGYECGIGLENYNDIKVGDTIEAFEVVEEAATL
ncbi:MAG: translation initiation factor IF-2 [Desulfovibrionaceae bacterium]|nr:translation initiation factor IF-2 [Desulfovibrionaceae bacterium]